MAPGGARAQQCLLAQVQAPLLPQALPQEEARWRRPARAEPVRPGALRRHLRRGLDRQGAHPLHGLHVPDPRPQPHQLLAHEQERERGRLVDGVPPRQDPARRPQPPHGHDQRERFQREGLLAVARHGHAGGRRFPARVHHRSQRVVWRPRPAASPRDRPARRHLPPLPLGGRRQSAQRRLHQAQLPYHRAARGQGPDRGDRGQARRPVRALQGRVRDPEEQPRGLRRGGRQRLGRGRRLGLGRGRGRGHGRAQEAEDVEQARDHAEDRHSHHRGGQGPGPQRPTRRAPQGLQGRDRPARRRAAHGALPGQRPHVSVQVLADDDCAALLERRGARRPRRAPHV